MNSLLPLIIYTANILGSFQDPFEFEGDYGPDMSPVRAKVFELVVSKEALAKNLGNPEMIGQARSEDLVHGPVLQELLPLDLINELVAKQKILDHTKFNDQDLEHILSFLERYKDIKLFYFLKNIPSEFLSLDKILRDKASRENKNLDLKILSSLEPLSGQSSLGLKIDLLDQLFTSEILNLTSSNEKVSLKLQQLDAEFLKLSFGVEPNPEDLKFISTPSGQVFFYWLYQILNLHLVSVDLGLVEQINNVKEIFARTLGDSQNRAKIFKEKLTNANASILFTQESDVYTQQALVNDGLFLAVDKQNPKDGTLIFLRSDLWMPDYEVISFNDYEGFAKGRVNTILATTVTGQKILLASAHGNSTRSEDGRLQILLVAKKFEELVKEKGNEGLQLIIGMDANTKTEEDVRLLQEHLNDLGLLSTHMGPTTIKKRMVTVQHEKTCKLSIDEEDYLIVLKEEKGGLYSITEETIGFSFEKPDKNISLPNMDNLSDHYPVGATLAPVP